MTEQMRSQGGDAEVTVVGGSENLEVMSEAPRYLSYVGRIVAEHLPIHGDLVELGSGDGAQTGLTVNEPQRLTCIEPNANLHDALRQKHYRVAHTLSELAEATFDGAFSINCLEHIPDDVDALRQLARVVRAGSPIVVFVPAFMMLYSKMDHKVGHVRRYRRREMIGKFAEAGLAVDDVRYVDSLGWLMSLVYRLLPRRSGTPSVRAVKMFDQVIFPISRTLDKLVGHKFGKNLLIVGRKA